MAGALALLILFLLFCCGSTGRTILGIVLFLLFIAITKNWLLLLLIPIPILLAFGLNLLLKKESLFNKIKHNTNIHESLEINDKTISKLVKLVGRMPNDGTPISQSNVKGITSVEWDLYLDWFRRNANEYVVVSAQNTVQVKSKTDKIRLTHKLLKMKSDLLLESSYSYQ